MSTRGIASVSTLLADLVDRHVASEVRTYLDDMEQAREQRDAWVEFAAELLGRLDAVAPMMTRELDAQVLEMPTLPKPLQARFAESREESRRAETSGANARLRRAS